jgi:hypothetical protein
MPLIGPVREHVGDVSPDRSLNWGLCIAIFSGPSPMLVGYSNLPPSWYERAFSDAYGIEAYVREMSGGREPVTWQVFGPVELMPLQSKLNLDRQGHQALSQGLRDAARSKGVPVDSVAHFLWVFNDGMSSGGQYLSPTDDSVLGAFDFTAQNACHEMMHQYGVSRHADSYGDDGKVIEYGDSFCIMGRGPTSRSFQNGRLSQLENDRTHAACGPGLCAPYLVQAGWANYEDHVLQLSWEFFPPAPFSFWPDWFPFRSRGRKNITLSANFGAPPPDQPRSIAAAFGPLSAGATPHPQQWIEYRTPINSPPAEPSPVGPDLPEEGALVVHEVRNDGALHAIFLEAVPATVGEKISIKSPLDAPTDLVIAEVNLQVYPPQVTLTTAAA